MGRPKRDKGCQIFQDICEGMKPGKIFLIIALIAVSISFIIKYSIIRYYSNYYKSHGLRDEKGITAFYFNNTNWNGEPIFTSFEEKIGFERVEDLVDKGIGREFYSISYHGLLEIPVTGKYKFKLFSDDGSYLYLNGLPFVINDGIHPVKEASSCRFIMKGIYPIEVKYFQAGGEASLNVFWRPPNPFKDLKGQIPADFVKPIGPEFNYSKVLKLRKTVEDLDGIFRISIVILLISILNLIWKVVSNSLILKFRNFLLWIPYHLRYILSLFIVTRIVLTIIGVCSRMLLDVFGRYQADWVYSKSLWLDIWGLWDTGWYVKIADTGYPYNLNTEVARWGFFPLYSLLMRILNILTGDSYISGLIISNICLFITCIFLYKLVLLYNDDKTALRSVRYLFLFPGAFILSGVFSESLFLMLAVITFYFSRKGKWHLAAIAGFFFAFTRSNGVFILLPILYEYLSSKGFRFKDIRLDIIFLFLIPLGIILFSLFCYYRTGSFSAYVYSKQTRFRMALGNPLSSLHLCLTSGDISLIFNAVFSIISLLILFFSYKRLGFSYRLYGILLIFIPLLYACGRSELKPVVGSMTGMVRFAVPIFPFYILFAKLGEKEYIDRSLTFFLAILQGFLMVFWSAGFNLVV